MNLLIHSVLNIMSDYLQASLLYERALWVVTTNRSVEFLLLEKKLMDLG